MGEGTAVTIRGEKIVTVLAVLGVLVGFAQAREKDHSADYQVGTFSSTGTISDGSYANCSGGGCSAYSAAHNIHYVSTADGVYAIEAPTSVAGTMLVGMMSGGNAPTIHKGWFMDNLHEGDKVLFAAKCKTYRNNHTSCQFWLPNPDKTGKEILTVGGFSPAVAKTNTSQLCGTGKLSASVEAQVCNAAPAPAEQPQPQPAAATSQQPQAAIRPAVQQAPQTPACQTVVTDANGNETCQQQ
jgi:hypothetical protein